MKTLSICVPTYNTEAYLSRCLDSVLVPEALDALELIIVNDGSKDSSPELARAYQARFPETVVFIDKENGGHGSTINAALKVASGRYFRVLDSDDWFDTPNFLRYLERLSGCDEDLIVTPYSQEYVETGVSVRYDYEWLEDGRVYAASELSCGAERLYVTMHASTFKTALLRECALELFEHCFYVDMMYIFYPIPFLKSFRFLDCSVYRYFIGRAEQSMNPAVFLRNMPQHEKVLRWMVEYYAAFRDRLLPNLREYMAYILYLMFHTHMELVCIRLPDRKLAYRSIKELDAWLKETAPDLWQQVGSYPYMHYSRKLKFLNVRYFNRLFLALGALVRRRRAART